MPDTGYAPFVPPRVLAELVREARPIVPPMVVVQPWIESERGWGQRPDGYSLHASYAECQAYIAAYWQRQPDYVPDEYSRPTEASYFVDSRHLTDDQRAAVGANPGGVRLYDAHQPRRQAP